MPRQPRCYSLSKVYHIIYKGIEAKDIFYDKNDRKFFLKRLKSNKEEYQYRIYAYCLMSNHVHLVIEIDDDKLSEAMKSLSISYVLYFNRKYERSGPLFQNRFNSKCVENKKYFLDVCRYVHQNPKKAKICEVQNYEWSSYNEYIGKEKIIDKRVLLHYFDDDLKLFRQYTIKENSDNEYAFMEYELRESMCDDELAEIIVHKLNLKN